MDSIAGANANAVDIADRALANDAFRQVLMTGEHLQVALMTLPVGEEIGVRTQHGLDQLIYLIEGYAEVTVKARTHAADAGRGCAARG
jgi:mannose-6-phosphate isomerase-like protein (cupin superfamily)